MSLDWKLELNYSYVGDSGMSGHCCTLASQVLKGKQSAQQRHHTVTTGVATVTSHMHRTRTEGSGLNWQTNVAPRLLPGRLIVLWFGSVFSAECKRPTRAVRTMLLACLSPKTSILSPSKVLETVMPPKHHIIDLICHYLTLYILSSFH